MLFLSFLLCFFLNIMKRCFMHLYHFLFWIGVKTLYIEPGSPREKGYVESFIGKLRDELLNGEIFDTLLEARVLTERWRREYNRYRPHSSLGYRPPAPEAFEAANLTLQVVH